MTASVVSWTPAARTSSARRLIMRIGYRSLRRSANGRILWMCSVGAQHAAPLPSATFPRGHCETARLSPHHGSGCRERDARASSPGFSQTTGPYWPRAVRGPSRDGAGSGAHARRDPRDRLHRRRAALVLQSLWAYATAGRGDAQERGIARAVGPHVRRHDLRGLGAQPRKGEDPRTSVLVRARFRGLDQTDARRLAGMGRSLQHVPRSRAEGRDLVGILQRGVSLESERWPNSLRLLY